VIPCNIAVKMQYYPINILVVQHMKRSYEGSGIQAWPVSFAGADDEEIVRILDASLRKFESKKNEEIINIILLVELSSAARRIEIASIIKGLKRGFEPNNFNAEPRNFDLINGIYHIEIHRDTVIGQVYPGNKIFDVSHQNFIVIKL